MANQYDFQEIGRLPASDDNVAIATRRVNAGAEINYNDHRFTISHYNFRGTSVRNSGDSQGGTTVVMGAAFRGCNH